VAAAAGASGAAGAAAVGAAAVGAATVEPAGGAANCEAADSKAAACGELFNKEATSGVTVFIALPKLLVISSKPSLFT